MLPTDSSMTRRDWTNLLEIRKHKRKREELQQKIDELKRIVRRKFDEDGAVLRLADDEKREARRVRREKDGYCHLADTCKDLLVELGLAG